MTHFYVSKDILSRHKPAKTLLFSIILIFLSIALKAQIVYQEIRPGQQITTDNSCHIDLNNDGIVDIDLVRTYHDGYTSRRHKFF